MELSDRGESDEPMEGPPFGDYDPEGYDDAPITDPFGTDEGVPDNGLDEDLDLPVIEGVAPLIVNFDVSIFSDVPSTLEIEAAQRYHMATIEEVFSRHHNYADEIRLRDGTSLSEIRLECSMPAGTAFSEVDTEGKVTVYIRGLGGSESLHVYRPTHEGIVRIDPDLAQVKRKPLPGEFPTSVHWALAYSEDMATELQAGRLIGPSEEKYVSAMLRQADLRQITFSELDTVYQRRRETQTPTTREDSEAGAKELTRYIHELISREGSDMRYTHHQPFIKDAIGENGSYVSVKAAPGHSADGRKGPGGFVAIHADWNSSREQLLATFPMQQERLTHVREAKTSIDLRYAVHEGLLYVSKRALVTDNDTSRPLITNPSLSVFGDVLEARRVRMFARRPTLSRRFFNTTL